MKIAVVLPDLRGGGAERMRLTLAHEWLMRGHEVDFVVLRHEGDLLPMVPPNARIVNLEAVRLRDALFPLLSYIRRERPTVLLAAMWPLTVIAIISAKLAITETSIAVSDHSILSKSYQHKGPIHRALLRASMALIYRLADTRIAVSKGVAADASALSGIAQERFEIIYNPAASSKEPDRSADIPLELVNIRGPLILAVGTFKEVKDFPLLITAFSEIASQSNATLCILGEGALRRDLEELVVRLRLQGRVLLPGFKFDTTPWYDRADLFVLSSKHEGFGNVIVEALNHGIPVVSTDCISGPREILQDGKFGRLVPVGDVCALAVAMQASLATSPDRAMLKARAREFSASRIADRYLEVMLHSPTGSISQ